MIKEYVYSKGVALGGDEGVVVLSIKVNKPTMEFPKVYIQFQAIGETGQVKVLFTDTSFIETLEMFIQAIKTEIGDRITEVSVLEKAMIQQAELLNPEAFKNRLMMQFLTQAQGGQDVGQTSTTNGSDAGKQSVSSNKGKK